MAAIERIERTMVDLAPKVQRTDAIQSFVRQQTTLVTITDVPETPVIDIGIDWDEDALTSRALPEFSMTITEATA